MDPRAHRGDFDAQNEGDFDRAAVPGRVAQPRRGRRQVSRRACWISASRCRSRYAWSGRARAQPADRLQAARKIIRAAGAPYRGTGS
jgi:hypothetical protein